MLTTRIYQSLLSRPFLRRCATPTIRPITTSPAPWANKNFPPRPKPIPEEEFTEVFLKGSGPGGQKINKTSSAVQLKHLPTGLVLKVQSTRSRTQNRNLAREMLASRVEELEKGAGSRAAIVRDIKSKRKASSAKKSRRKYARLEAEKQAAAQAAEEGVDGLAEEGEMRKDGKVDGGREG